MRLAMGPCQIDLHPHPPFLNDEVLWMSQEVSKRLVSGLYPQDILFISSL